MSLLERAPTPARNPRHSAAAAATTATGPSGDVLPAGGGAGRRIGSSRAVLVGVTVAVTLLALLAGAVVAAGRAGAAPRLLLTIDGDTVTVTSAGQTVGDLLREQGVTTTNRDAVMPAPLTPLDGVAAVAVGYARPVQLTLDGTTRREWTTAPDVAGLLASLHLPAGSYLSASPLAPLPRAGAELTVRTPKDVTVVADGATTPLITTAGTVGDALADPQVGYRPGDRLSVSPATPVAAGATYRMVRVEVNDVVNRVLLRADTHWVRRASLPVGASQVLTTGHDGERKRVVRLRYEDGRTVDRQVRSDRVLSRAVDWVIAIGTGRPATGPKSNATISYPKAWTPATGKVAGDPDFAALARCESGGNPRAVNPSGKYRGLYQFDLTTWGGVGGTGDPIEASPAEQTTRARILYNDRGRAPWPYCGRFL